MLTRLIWRVIIKKKAKEGARMEEYVRKNGYVEVCVNGEFVGNYDTIEEYHKEQEEEGE